MSKTTVKTLAKVIANDAKTQESFWLKASMLGAIQFVREEQEWIAYRNQYLGELN